jgi:hypothetical protein
MPACLWINAGAWHCYVSAELSNMTAVCVRIPLRSMRTEPEVCKPEVLLSVNTQQIADWLGAHDHGYALGSREGR